MADLPYGINAWIFLNEDEPLKTNYNSSDSCYQSLIKYKIYDSISFLGIAFFEVTSATKGSTIKIGDASSHPDGLTNQDYLISVLKDARQVNPNIKFLATMAYKGANTLASVFSKNSDKKTEEAEANLFAKNLVAYLKDSGMNGLDIDWEGKLADLLAPSQFQILFSAIRTEFDKQPVKYYLTMAPAGPTSGTETDTVNSAFDIVSPQFYDGSQLSEYLEAGISPAKIGYGAQFEPGNAAPNASAQQVWDSVKDGFSDQKTQYDYQDIIVWRFNSGNFQFEQAQIMILNQLAYPPTGNTFDDSPIVAAAGNPSITQMTIRSGEVLNAIQAVNTGNSRYNYGTQPSGTKVGVFTLLQHGGNSGGSQTVDIPLDDPIVSISGYTGVWYGWQCVLQLTLTGKSGKTYGPFGNMDGSTSRNEFTQSAEPGRSVVAFSGSTVTVPLADGSHTAVIASLNAVFA